MNAVAVGAILFAIFLAIVAVMVFQELRKAGPPAPTYVLDEVVPYAFLRLSESAAARIDREDVKRILEWEVFYLQGLAGARDGNGNGHPIAGSSEAVAFIAGRTAERGARYQAADIAEVLYHEASYLAEIGAVGPAVDEAGQ